MSNLSWLKIFESDEARLAAVVIICVTWIIVRCAPVAIRAWQEDRKGKRETELARKRLDQKIERELEKRKRKEGKHG